MARVLMLSNVARSFPGFAEGRVALEAAGHDLVDPGARHVPANEVAELIGDIDGVLVGGTHELRGPALRRAPRLKAIVREGIGVDTIDLDVATDLGIVVSNTAGSNSDSVADHAFSLALALVRDLVRHDHETRAGRGWDKRPPLGQLAGRTIGVVGTGAVGSAVTRRAAGFGMRILGNDLVPNATLAADHGVDYRSLPDLLRDADVVTLHVPLTELTRGLVGAAELALMKPDAVLINTARGEIVDLDALEQALRDGRLAGAGLDVFPIEPLVEHGIFGLPNVIATPHVGGNSTESSFKARMWGARNLIAALDGQPRDVANPEVRTEPGLRIAAISLS